MTVAGGDDIGEEAVVMGDDLGLYGSVGDCEVSKEGRVGDVVGRTHNPSSIAARSIAVNQLAVRSTWLRPLSRLPGSVLKQLDDFFIFLAGDSITRCKPGPSTLRQAHFGLADALPSLDQHAWGYLRLELWRLPRKR